MSEELQAFVARVEQFEIDPGDKSLRFVDRLARENSWTRSFAQRVVDEYKRFCILAMRAGHPVTPSEEVDQAWHLHLTYTRSYWDRFCRELGKPLHHEPTAGGVSEGAKFRSWYAETLASYERIFGHVPPPDVWPSPRQRFEHAGDWKWVNVGRYWMIPRQRTWIAIMVAFVVVFLTVLPGCAAAMRSPDSNLALLSDIALFKIPPFNLNGTQFLNFYAGLGAIALLAGVFTRLYLVDQERKASIGQEQPNLSTDELAVLAGGLRRLTEVSLTRLFTSGAISAEKKLMGWKFNATGPAPPSTGLDHELYMAITMGTATDKLGSTAKPHFDRIADRLQSLGLRRGEGAVYLPVLFVVLAILALGGMRLLQGIAAGEEVGFLIGLMFLVTVVGILISVRYSMNTPLGIATYEANKDRASKTELTASSEQMVQSEMERGRSGEPTDSLAMCVAVLGIAAFSDIPELTPLSQAVPRVGSGIYS
ncbi:MAG TPA: hypothetical protein DDW52_28615, partial [Planctomycetaceae bacterium]|nr:hypothetical protein [Planctomycetaceae bacterium]